MKSFLVGIKTMRDVAFAIFKYKERMKEVYDKTGIKEYKELADEADRYKIKDLLRLNLKAIQHRYGAEDEVREEQYIEYSNSNFTTSYEQAFKSIRCLLYQLNVDGDDEVMDATDFLNRVASFLAYEIAIEASKDKKYYWGD